MFLQPRLAGEDTYYNNGGGGYDQNEPESPDTFYFVQDPSLLPLIESTSQTPSPAQAYAQSYVETHQQPLNGHHDDDHNEQEEEEDRQPLTSDSAHTPPSPIITSGRRSAATQRRSIQRPSQMNNNNNNMFKRTSHSHTTTTGTGHTSSGHSNIKDNNNAHTKQRSPSLNTLPQKTLIQLLQTKEEETRQAKKMLRTALVQLEMEVGRGEILAGRVRELERVEKEKGERERGGEMKVLKGVLDEQRGRVGGGREVEGLKLKLSNTERELQRIKEDYRALQIERDDSDRALVRARTLAREMKEKAMLIQAREQGRQEGFEEGLRQGRLGASINEESSGVERVRSRKTRERSTTNKISSRRNTHANPSLEVEASERERELREARERGLREARERELREARERELREARERELREARERELREAMERELREAKERDLREREREREDLKREVEKERWEREKEKEHWEREKEKDRLERAKEREALKRQVEKERRQVKEQMEKEKQDVERKLVLAEEIRMKEKEKLEKQLKKEKDKAAAMAAAAPPLPYLAMAPPPIIPPKRPSTSSTTTTTNDNRHRRRSSSSASTIPFDMLQLPTGDLSVILEDVSGSPSVPAAPLPSWLTNPPIDYGKIQNDSRGGPHWSQEPTHNGRGPHNRDHSDYLTPPYNNNDGASQRSSTGSYEISIVPPSRPGSVVGGGHPPESDNNTHNNTNTDDPTNNKYLSPNHRPIPLPQPESPSSKPIPILPRYSTPHPRHQQPYDTSGIPTQPNSPVMGTPMDVLSGGAGFPPGFIPQSITDARGRSTPIIGGMSGTGFIPPPPSLPGRSGTPNNQWHNNPVIPQRPISPASIPIYGNPITLEREKKRDQEADLPATTAPPSPSAPLPQSPGEAWSAPLSVLHPPIFPITTPHEPFQQPPPPPGSWGGGTNNQQGNRQFESSPSLNTRPVIPGQTSTLGGGGSGGGGGGGSTWGGGTPSQRAGGFGSGMTPGPRNQDLPPVIPGQTSSSGHNGWGTPSQRVGGFGSGMTPGPRNPQDLPPGGGGGGWGTPSHRPGTFGSGMTSGHGNQDLPPVFPSQTGGGGGGGNGGGDGWGTPLGGPGMTPGPRNHQELPNPSGFSIYAPAANGGVPRAPSPYQNPVRSSSPYRHIEEEDGGEDGDREDDPITVMNTRMNANNVAPSMAPPVVSMGGGGGKKGKKGGRKR